MRKTIVLALLALMVCACQPKPAAPAQVTPEEVGLTWRECPASALESMQVEACLGPYPVRSEADAARYGTRTGRGLRLELGGATYETRHVALGLVAGLPPDAYILQRNGRPLALLFGVFETYDPDVSLQTIAGQVTWEFADARTATIIYGGRDLRGVYKLQAAYRPYELGGKLAFIGKKDSRYFLVCDGKQVGPSFERMPIAYCCEAMLYAPTGAAGRYRFWGYRDGQLYAVEVTAGEPHSPGAAYRDNQLCFAIEGTTSDWAVDGVNGAFAGFTSKAAGARYVISSINAGSSPTLDAALDDLERGSLGPYVQTVENVTIGGRDARWITLGEGAEYRHCVLVIAPDCGGEGVHPLAISAREADRAAFQAILAQVRLGDAAILPRAFKGWELYSWPAGDDWRYTLIMGTNRNKTYEEITAEGSSESGGLARFTVTGVARLKAVLDRLPRGEAVFWIDDTGWAQANGAKGGFARPDPATVQEIKRYCERRGIQFPGPALVATAEPTPSATLTPSPPPPTVTPTASATPWPSATLRPGQPTPTPDYRGDRACDLQTTIVTSPDGQWIAETVEALPGGSVCRNNYFAGLAVTSRDGGITWEAAAGWSNWGFGWTSPHVLQWSRDGRSLYFTNIAHPDGCCPLNNGWDLLRLDLETGAVTTLWPGPGFWLTLSPDEATLAAAGSDHLTLRDLASGQDRILALPGATREMQSGGIVWSPDGETLVLALVQGVCTSGIRFAIVRVDVATLACTTLVEPDSRLFVPRGWSEADRVLLTDRNRKWWWLNPHTGEVTPAL